MGRDSICRACPYQDIKYYMENEKIQMREAFHTGSKDEWKKSLICDIALLQSSALPP